MARTDVASRIIKASPGAIYAAFIDPDALVKWLAPEGKRGKAPSLPFFARMCLKAYERKITMRA